MKKSGIALLLIFFGLLSCSRPGTVKFEVPYESSFVVPANTVTAFPLDFWSPEMSSTSAAEYEANDTRVDLLTALYLKSLDLEIVSPDDANFNFLKSATLSIKAEGLPEKQVASRENIPDDNSKTLGMDISRLDLKDYIKAGKFTLKCNTVTDRYISKDITVKVKAVFDAEADVLKK